MLACSALAAPADLRGNALLDELQHRAVKFFWQESHPKTGLTKDRAATLKDSDKFDVASIASVGFALSAYPIGVERKWLKRDDALKRTRLTLDTILNKLDGTRGWYYHFVNWETGKRVWNCELSSIDTSIMLAGVIQARQYWKDRQVTRDADAILRKVDWVWMMRDTKGNAPHEFFSMGWTPEKGWIPATWAAYNELMMLYLQAYGYSNIRTDGWDKFGRNVYTDRGHTSIEGGPLFMHQMSHVFYDFSNRRDRLGFNYWVATREATLANRA
ncbi:MAG TPA: glucoamylase family protein, partial [Fimbriimonas sp.]